MFTMSFDSCSPKDSDTPRGQPTIATPSSWMTILEPPITIQTKKQKTIIQIELALTWR